MSESTHTETSAATDAPATDRAPASSSYDAIPYSVGAFPQTRPDRLAILATLFGLNPASPARCRVLELGCAAGGNIIPMALAAPEAEFVGIDLSARQITDAQATARQLNLSNLDLRSLSILDIPEDFGQFDYILCHGVYSWVPPDVQDRILQVCARHLTQQGIAYISYNCYPGWHARGAIREMLWYHTEQYQDPKVRIRAARGLLAFLAKAAPAGTSDGGYNSLIRHELALLMITPDTYLLHEHLEEFNEPLYFHQFAGRAAAKGLQYLGEAQLSAMMPSRFGPEIERTLRAIAPDLLHMEQYMDFLRNRMFRQTLLCRADLSPQYALDADSIRNFYIASPAKAVSAHPDIASDQPEQFKGPHDPTLTTRDPLMKASMLHLIEHWPLPIHFAELLDAARQRLGPAAPPPSDNDAHQLATRLLNCYTSNLVEFSLSPPGFVIDVSPRPRAGPYARLRAKTGDKTTNLRLETVALSAASRLILENLDGEHDRAALIQLLTDWINTVAPTAPLPPVHADAQVSTATTAPLDPPEVRAAKYIDELLPAFARYALFIA
jgi:methyltransferase-like protein/2-polyprenyl-3-methyl-5-hydroxy-6-metoxy-1,4-benzoquinol methylase